MIPQDLDQFVDSVLDQKAGMDQVEVPVRAQLKQNFVQGLEQQVNAAIVAAMSPATLEAFEKVLDSGDQAAMAEFYKTHVPNLTEIVTEVLIRFKTNYIGA